MKIHLIAFALFVSATVQAQTPAQLLAEIAALKVTVNALQVTVANLKKSQATTQMTDSVQAAAVATLQFQMNKVWNNPVLGLGPYVTVDSGTEVGLPGPHVIFHRCNVHIIMMQELPISKMASGTW
jgi:hypothetical protein